MHLPREHYFEGSALLLDDDDLQEQSIPRQLILNGKYSQTIHHELKKCNRSWFLWLIVSYAVTCVISFGLGYCVAIKRHALPNVESIYSKDVAPIAIRKYLQSISERPFVTLTESPLLDHSDGAPKQAHLPSPEVDDFWVSHGHSHLFLITETDLIRLGKDPSKHVRIPDGWGYGDNVFLTRLDHMHQFHCLNWLRQLLHPEYYNKTSATDIGHGDHCVRTLFDYLNCHASYEVHNYVWMENRPQPWPDFVSKRECRSMQELLEFDSTHSVDTDARIMSLIPPEDAYLHQQDAATQAFLDLVLLDNPDYPQLEEETRLRTKDFELAISEWRETGEIPRIENLKPWQGV